MDSSKNKLQNQEQSITVDDVKRVLDIGFLLVSVLTDEELLVVQEQFLQSVSEKEIGNTGVS